MSLYSQNVSNNPLSLDGLIVGNFDEVYINGQPVTPTDTSGLVPYTGATTAVNLNNKKITTTYTAVNAEDLTNKDFTDTTYLAKAGFFVNSGTFHFDMPATVRISNADFFISCPVSSIVAVLALDSTGKVVQVTTSGVGNAFLGATQTFFGYNTFSLFLTTTGIINTGDISTTGLLTCDKLDITGLTTATPILALGINASNQVVKFAGGIGDAILAGGTIPFPQQFTGYNAFINPLRISTLTFSTPVTAGTASYILGVDVTGNLISTTPTTSPSTLTITNTAVSNTYYPTWITSTTTGVKTIFGVNGVSYDLPSGILTTTQLKITTVPVGTTQYILAVDSTGNVIRGTVTAGDAVLANTQTFTGVNTFSNDMILSKSFSLTLGAVNIFQVRNSSLVTQFTVTNTGVTMGNLVMTGTILNMSSTSPNFIYSGDSLAITASTNTTKSIIISVAGTGLTLDQFGASFSSAAKTLICSSIQPHSGFDLNILNSTSNINISAVNILYGVTTGHFFSVNSVDKMYLRSSGLNIPISTSTHPTLDAYELVLGNNSATIGDSAKMIIRGKASVTTSGANKGPSVDFTAWDSHATPQASIEVLDDNFWGGIFKFKAKANGAGSVGAMTEVLDARVTGFRFQANPQFGVNDASYVYASDSASNLYRVCQQQTFQFNQDGAAWTGGVVLGSFAKRDGGSKISWVASATQYTTGASTMIFQVAFTNLSTGTVYAYNQNTFTNIGSAHWVCPNIQSINTLPAGTYAVSVSGNWLSDANDYVRLQITISPA